VFPWVFIYVSFNGPSNCYAYTESNDRVVSEQLV
jgi:hypothetical protein